MWPLPMALERIRTSVVSVFGACAFKVLPGVVSLLGNSIGRTPRFRLPHLPTGATFRWRLTLLDMRELSDDTLFGHHLVTDLARRVAPIGEVRRVLDLSQIKNVYPVVEIPRWLVSRFFYDTLGQVILCLLVPFFAAYVLYRCFAYYLVVTRDPSVPFSQSYLHYLQLPRVHELFLDVYLFTLIGLAVLALFFLAVRRGARRAATLAAREEASGRRLAEAYRTEIEGVVRAEKSPPMEPEHGALNLDVLVTGHTHLPRLSETRRGDGGRCVIANSGCRLRQLSPLAASFGGPPVFVSHFVLTHVRVFARDGGLQVEL